MYTHRPAFTLRVPFRSLCLLALATVALLLQASLNFDDPTLKALIASLPEAPALAQRGCLQRCGLLDDDDFSYDFDS